MSFKVNLFLEIPRPGGQQLLPDASCRGGSQGAGGVGLPRGGVTSQFVSSFPSRQRGTALCSQAALRGEGPYGVENLPAPEQVMKT